MEETGQFGGQKRRGSERLAEPLTHKETRQVWEIIQITGVNKAPTGVGRGDVKKPYNLSEHGLPLCEMGIIVSHTVELRVTCDSGEEILWQIIHNSYFK